MKCKSSARNLHLFCGVLFLLLGLHTKASAIELPPLTPQDPIEVSLTTNWQKYSSVNGVLIEYRMESMESQDYGREVNMLVFRFTNTTKQTKDCSWVVKIERNYQCTNCESLKNPDETFVLQLAPKEVAEGKASNLITRSELNVFGNFVKLVPGMSEQRLTAFELINLTVN